MCSFLWNEVHMYIVPITETHMCRNLVGSIYMYEKFGIKFPQKQNER
jgi:hypothetical protein